MTDPTEESSFSTSNYEAVAKEKGKKVKAKHAVEKPYACPLCDVTCGWKSHMVKHMRTHTGEKPFPCSVCQQGFAAKDTLVKHMRTHTGERPYACSLCDKTFSRKAEMLNHQRTHTGEKPFSCSICKKSFAWRGALRSHMRIHSGEKPFACSQCDKTFARKFQLSRHERVHTDDKPFNCSICEKTSAWEDSIIRHMKTHMEEQSGHQNVFKVVHSCSHDHAEPSRDDQEDPESGISGPVEEEESQSERLDSEVQETMSANREDQETGECTISRKIKEEQQVDTHATAVHENAFCSICYREYAKDESDAENSIDVLLCEQCRQTTVLCSICDKTLPLSTLREHLAQHSSDSKSYL